LSIEKREKKVIDSKKTPILWVKEEKLQRKAPWWASVVRGGSGKEGGEELVN